MGEGQTYIGIALFVLFLIIDAVLYAFSAALGNINDNELEKKVEEGNKRAVRLKKLMDDPSRFGDTLDIVVFVTNVVAGAYILVVIQRSVSKSFGGDSPWLVWMPVLVGAVMLLILIVFGVLIPKKCGKRSAGKVAYSLSGTVCAVIILLFPFTKAVTLISHLFLRIFGIDPNEKLDNVTEEEIITMVNEGQEQGVLEASEAEMIANIFELGDKNAGDIMTHRSAIVALDGHMTLEEVIQKHIDGNYSRFPVYDGDIDNIIGTLHIRDALIMYRNIPSRKKQIAALRTIIRPAYFVPDTRDIDDLLKDMQAEKIHMGIVVDEYGQTAGVISMEDIIEEIVGNILDEYDIEEDSIEHNSDDSYIVDGLTELDDLNKLIGTEIESEDFDTLNGYLISLLNRIPEENETAEITADGYVFRILEVSGNVIRRVEVLREKEKAEEKEDKETADSPQ